jgi:hypothetical protein
LHDMEKLAGKEEPQAISPFQELSH